MPYLGNDKMAVRFDFCKWSEKLHQVVAVKAARSFDVEFRDACHDFQETCFGNPAICKFYNSKKLFWRKFCECRRKSTLDFSSVFQEPERLIFKRYFFHARMKLFVCEHNQRGFCSRLY